MTIDLLYKRIYHYDKDGKIKEHKPFKTNFAVFEILPNGKVLVVENYYKYENGNRSNLYCINQNVEVEWFLPYPNNKRNNGMNNYVGFTTHGNQIFANTFSCLRVEINTEEGKIIQIQETR